MSDEASVPSENSRCRYCQHKMLPGALVCHNCNHYKNRVLNFVKVLAPGTALVMVAIAIVQLMIAFGEKIDTRQMLEEVEAVKDKAEIVFQDVKQQEVQLSNRVQEISTAIDTLDRKFGTSQKILAETQSELSERIDDTRKTAENDIKGTLESVNKLAAESKRTLAGIEKEFQGKQKELRSQLRSLKEELSHQLAELTWRNKLALLADAAITDSERSAYDELVKIINNKNEKNEEKLKMAMSFRLQVKRFYIGINRFKAFEFGTDPKTLSIHQLKTMMDTVPIPMVRYKIAEHLGKRKELGVPEILISCFESDKSLDVLCSCVRSYCRVTGYQSNDVFGESGLLKHWSENREAITEKLKEPEPEKAK